MNLDWLGQVPGRGRVDALLEKFNDSASDSDDEFDYAKFAASRAKPVAVDTVGDTVESDDDIVAMEAPEPQTMQDSLSNEVELSITPTKRDQPNEIASPPIPATHETPDPAPKMTKERREELLAEIRAEIGLDEAAEKDQKDQKQQEYHEHEDQKLERLLAREIGHHTTKQATVASFLADLDAPDSPPSGGISSTPNTSPMNSKGRELEFSSPPRMQTLKSFVGRPRDHNKSIDLSDSDLEIVPETIADRRSKPVRQMLQFAGKHGDAKGTQMFRTLREKQRKQLVDQRERKVAELKAQGIDLEAEAQQERESLIEAERRKAEEIRQQESDWEGDGLSDLDVEHASEKELVLSGSESEVESGSGSGSEESDNTRYTRSKIVSVVDSDESDDEAQPEKLPEPEKLPQLATKENTFFDGPTQATTAVVAASAEATQIAPPVSDELRRAFLRPNPLPPMPEEESDDEALSDELAKAKRSPRKEVVRPDLTNIGGPGISLSQEMLEVRRRFLAAQEKKRLMANKTSKAKMFFDQEAEESDDEWAGLGGSDHDDDDDENANVAGLVDDAAPDARQSELQKVWAEQQRNRDERLVQEMVQNVHGGFRRRQARGESGYGFLSDGDDDDDDIQRAVADEKRRRAERDKRRRQKAIEGNAAVQKLAGRETTKAFLDCISEDVIKPVMTTTAPIVSVEETLTLLRRASSATEDASDSDEGGDSILPRVNLDLRAAPKPSDMAAPGARRKSTYASRVAGGDVSDEKQVEILLSLGGNTNKFSRPRKSNSRMVAAPAQPTKARKVMTTRTHAADLFKRSWNS